jgi:hypothetical protein
MLLEVEIVNATAGSAAVEPESPAVFTGGEYWTSRPRHLALPGQSLASRLEARLQARMWEAIHRLTEETDATP